MDYSYFVFVMFCTDGREIWLTAEAVPLVHVEQLG